MEVQWYPGHMTKARRAMQEDIRLVDLVIELADARIPRASRNPEIDRMAQNKARLLILNKADLADERISRMWQESFAKRGISVVAADSRSTAGRGAVLRVIQETCREKTERDRRRGILNRPVRAMVVGIPNVGKSTFINTVAGRACAKTGNRPGVTRGNQWIRLNRQTELLDTPGLLWPKFEDKSVGVRLAMVGAVRDEVFDQTELALEILRFLRGRYPQALAERYGVGAEEETGELALLERLARKKSCLRAGNEPDTGRMAAMLADDFRGGRLGRISIDWPEEE